MYCRYPLEKALNEQKVTFFKSPKWGQNTFYLFFLNKGILGTLKGTVVSKYDVVSKNKINKKFCISIYGDNRTFRVEIAV
jgi:hypothetical protein